LADIEYIIHNIIPSNLQLRIAVFVTTMIRLSPMGLGREGLAWDIHLDAIYITF